MGSKPDDALAGSTIMQLSGILKAAAYLSQVEPEQFCDQYLPGKTSVPPTS
jgi:hypothetical protein